MASPGNIKCYTCEVSPMWLPKHELNKDDKMSSLGQEEDMN